MRLADRYTSTEWLRRENTRLWPSVWLLAGALVDVARPGQRLRLDIADESILVVRGQDGALRAFHNVCPHRGHRLCDAPHASGTTLRCPYHRWTFSLTGALHSRPDDAGFSTRPRLTPVRCGVVGGLVWVCMDPEAPALLDWLGPVAGWLAPYRSEAMSLTDDVTMPVPCNWKLMLDANNEHYHLHTVHPELLGMIDDTAVVTEQAEPHGRMVVPVGIPSGRKAVDEPERQRLRAAALTEQRRRLTQAGVDLTGLSDAQLLDNHMLYVFPNVQINCYADRLQIFRHRPHPADPARAHFDRLVLQHTGGPPVRSATHRRLDPKTDSLGPVLDADVVVVRSAQQGMSSRGFSGPIFGASESLLAMMHRTLGERLSG